MNNGDIKPAASAIVTTLLDESIDRYEKALSELAAAASASKKPTFQQIIEVLVARDVVEKKRMEDENPSGKSIARLIELDSRLKEQRQAIATEQGLSEWKENLNIPSTHWWWQLPDLEAIPNRAVERYQQALSILKSAVKDCTQTSLQIREVLLARDAVEQICTEERQPPQERIDRIMHLDEQLWELAGAIAQEEQVDKWKVHFKPPDSHWWWQITTKSPYFSQCVERYKKALDELEKADHPSPEQILKLLKARDTLEEALKVQPSIPEQIANTITELDRQLKQKRLALTKGKKLLDWKKSLSPPESNWWWNFKPTLFGDEDEPLPWRDRLWLIGALLCITFAAGFVVNTTQTFQAGMGKDKNGDVVRSDAAQNSLVILQGGSLLALSASALTKRGQKMVENFIISIPFLQPNLQAPATFFLSLAALGVTYAINQSLPALGDWWYFSQGQKLEEDNQFFQAQERYFQAKKFLNDADKKAKLSLALGKVYERQGNLKEAINEYTDALATDNANVINHLGRVMILERLQKVGWTGKLTEADEAIIRKAETYLKLVQSKLESGEKGTQREKAASEQGEDNPKNRLKKENYVNQGILYWSQIGLKQESWNRDLLDKAYDKFSEAQNLDDELPTTPEGRNVRCYLELADALKKTKLERDKMAKEWKKGEIYTICEQIFDASVEDINEENLMRSVFQLIIDNQSSTSHQEENQR